MIAFSFFEWRKPMARAINQVILRLPVELKDLLDQVKTVTTVSVNQQIINMIESKRPYLLKKIEKKIDRR
jgi:hypothetical protein